MMKRFFGLWTVVALICVTSCTSYKNVPYMINSDEVALMANLSEARITPKDELIITVSCPDDPAAVLQFNLTVSSNENTGERTKLTSQEILLPYLVRNDGTIDFPALGEIKVAGMTEDELEDYLATKIQGAYLKIRPVVNVRLNNFKVSVLGEVTSPGTFTMPAEKVSVYSALAMAKDLTIYGRRDNVKLIREDANGQKSIHELDLNDANLINSPYYYLQQNDVLYVTPNKTKAKNSEIGQSTSIWLSATGILVSVASLLTTILKIK